MIVRWVLVVGFLALFLAPNLGCAPATQPGDDIKVTARKGGLPQPPKDRMPKTSAK